MKRLYALLIACFLLICAVPALANVIDISGPWILDFPQGQGLAILQKIGGQPPMYQGQVTIPYPNKSGKLSFNVKMTSAPSYVVPGNNITFHPTTFPGIGCFQMNLSSSSSGVAWIITNAGSDKHIRAYYGVKAPAHR